MDRALLALVLAAVVVAVAAALQRSGPDPPTPTSAGFQAPPQLDRSDFADPARPWLVVVFSSATCTSCADVWTKAQVLESPQVAVQQVESRDDPGLHQRYRIEAVPTTVISDADGAVVSSFLGPVSATHLWAALAEARDPGSVPDGCDASTAGEAETGGSDDRSAPGPTPDG